MKCYIGIDPGINNCSVAVFNEYGILAGASLINPDKDIESHMERAVNVAFKTVRCIRDLIDKYEVFVFIEFTQARFGGSISTISILGLVSGLISGAIINKASVTIVNPSTWKSLFKTLAKVKGKTEIHNSIYERLSKSDIIVLNKVLSIYKKSLHHNILDAIGIVLWGMNKCHLT